MTRFIFLVFFYVPICFAQYEQIVKPVLIDEVVSYALYQFRQSMIEFFKSARSVNLVSSGHLSLQKDHICLNLTFDSVELFIERVSSVAPDGTLQIHESLNLKSCERSLELFKVERQGRKIQASSDAQLLRGIIPDSQDSEHYRLTFMAGRLSFEKTREIAKQILAVDFYFNSGSEIHALIEESFASKTLTNQSARLSYEKNGLVLEGQTVQYIWSLDARHFVPRQYLFVREQEASPEVYLKAKYSIFNDYLMNSIKGMVEFHKHSL